MNPDPPAISVVMPALNEEASIAAAIQSARGADEMIVVDGGSSDLTREIAQAAGARVRVTTACRGLQMAEGAREAGGEWLVFLHADTLLAPEACAFIRGIDRGVVGGAFRLRFDSPRPVYRLIEAMVRARTLALRLPYGDQAIFCRNPAYKAAGGIKHLPVMEDVAFIRALGRVGPLAFPTIDVLTSARRHEIRGPFRSAMRNLWLLTRYFAGADVEALARAYRP